MKMDMSIDNAVHVIVNNVLLDVAGDVIEYQGGDLDYVGDEIDYAIELLVINRILDTPLLMKAMIC